MATQQTPPDRSAVERDSSEVTTINESAITVEGLQKTYSSGDDTVRAVDDVSFTIEKGTAVGLLGPNGAGKTTTIKMLLSLIVPTSGTAIIDDIDVFENERAAYHRVGAMLEGARNVYWRLGYLVFRWCTDRGRKTGVMGHY